MIRKVIKIDTDICNGCGQCIPNCAEGALQMIDGKARLISDLFCDGLGACLGTCPVGAIEIEEREAQPYDERTVMAAMVPQGENTIIAHLKHLKDHGETDYVHQGLQVLAEKGWNIADIKAKIHGQQAGESCHSGGCPGSQVRMMSPSLDHNPVASLQVEKPRAPGKSQLKQWPVQLHLVPPKAQFFHNADVLIAADCVPFAYPDFHEKLLAGRVLLIGCPKLDDIDFYTEKLSAIFTSNTIRSVTVVHMEVPCCSGIVQSVKRALGGCGKIIPLADVTISIEGKIISSN